MDKYENIFLDYDVSHARKRKKVLKNSILVITAIGIVLVFFAMFFFVNNSSLNFKIRDKESSSILYSDTEKWSDSSIDSNILLSATSQPTTVPNVSTSPDEPSATPDPNEDNAIGITQIESSLVTPSPVETRVPITEGIFRTRKANFTEDIIVKNDNSYYSPTMSIELYDFRKYDSKIFVADIFIKSLDNFVPVFAEGEFDSGYNTTSQFAEDYNAVLAINSDSATAVDYGIIVRYQNIYRDILAGDHMAMFNNGVLKTYPSRNISADFLIKRGAEHVFCFGPKLFDSNGNATTFENSQYKHNTRKHPRTAIGMIAPFHYVVVVADGREEGYSEGLTLDELSELMYDLNCIEAYNLDGGGSSTMVFMGDLVNRPEGDTEERAIDSAILFKEMFAN